MKLTPINPVRFSHKDYNCEILGEKNFIAQYGPTEGHEAPTMQVYCELITDGIEIIWSIIHRILIIKV